MSPGKLDQAAIRHAGLSRSYRKLNDGPRAMAHAEAAARLQDAAGALRDVDRLDAGSNFTLTKGEL